MSVPLQTLASLFLSFLKIQPGKTKKSSGIIFTLSSETEDEVNEWANEVKATGGEIFHETGRDENGCFGFGSGDTDGHKFNVLLMDKECDG